MKKLFFTITFCFVAFTVFSQNAALLINSANEALQSKDYEKAFELYEAAMKNLGNVQVDASINYNTGFAAFHASEFYNAIPYFQKAISAKINVPKSYEFIGHSYARLNMFNEAITAYKKAVETGSKEKGNLYYNAGVVAYQSQKFDIAVEFFTLAIKENYENSDNAYLNKSIILKGLNKDEESKQTLIEALQKFEDNSKIIRVLTNIYIDEAISLYKNGADILKAAGEKVKTGFITDSIYISEVNIAKAEFKSAIEILTKAKALDASDMNVEKLIDACEAVLK